MFKRFVNQIGNVYSAHSENGGVKLARNRLFPFIVYFVNAVSHAQNRADRRPVAVGVKTRLNSKADWFAVVAFALKQRNAYYHRIGNRMRPVVAVVLVVKLMDFCKALVAAYAVFVPL